MKAHQTFLYSLILAEMVKVEGMKAENAAALFHGHAPKYWEDAFAQVTGSIENYAQQLINS
jgi:hypothetical protein